MIYSRSNLPPKTATETTIPTKTQQQFEPECNINNIMKKYRTTGTLPTRQGTPQFGDFSNIIDYQTACNALIEAQTSFAQLPADVRAKFQNNPASLISFINDDKNRDEAIGLGLIPKPKKTEEQKSEKTENKVPEGTGGTATK